MKSEPKSKSVREYHLWGRMLRVRPLAAFAICVALGAILAVNYAFPLLWTLIPTLLFCIAAVLLRKFRRTAALLAAAGFFLGASAVRLQTDLQPKIVSQKNVSISGTMGGAFQLETDEQRLVCTLSDVEIEGQAVPYSLRLYLRGSLKTLSKLEAGQKIHAKTGYVWKADSATNPYQYDFNAYLWRNHMAGYATVKAADASFDAAPPGVLRWLYRVRSRLSDAVDTLFPKNSGLAKALILGNRSDMDEELNEQFRLSGAAHLLAISGMHVSVLAALIAMLLGRFLPRKFAFWFTMAALVGYAVLIGYRASMARAILMYGLVGYGYIIGRPSDPLTRIGTAFLILFFINPLSIADAGFSLSFCASGGILLLNPILSDVLCPNGTGKNHSGIGRRIWHRTAQAISVTLSAQLATLPLVICYYGTFPVFATISNIVAVPLTLAAYGIGLAAVALSSVPVLPAILARCSDILLSVLTSLLQVFAKLPFNSVRMPALPLALGIVFAVLIFLCSDICAIRKKIRKWLLCTLPVCAALGIVVSLIGAMGLKIIFLDVGQGDGAVLFAQGNAYMVDVGLEETPADDYLRGSCTHPDAIFLTHPHTDHAAGLMSVLSETLPDTIYIPSGWWNVDMDDGIADAVAEAASLGVNIRELHSGDVIQLSKDVTATVLSPEEGSTDKNLNNLSLVLYITYGENSLLLTGDMEKKAEPDSVPQANILKVAHHGSSGATSANFLKKVQPKIAVISVGEGNSYGHPRAETLERLEKINAEIYRTDEYGAVTIRLFRNGKYCITGEIAP